MTAAPVDGRTLRGLRTRRAIASAYLQLLQRGGEPGFEQVAEEAGVGLRTVYNQFANLEALRAAAGAQLVERLEAEHGALVVGAAATLVERVDAFVAHRVAMLERLGPYSRATAATVAVSPQLRRVQALLVAMSMAELTSAFGPELVRVVGTRREELLQALHVVSTYPTWRGAREELDLDIAGAAGLMARMLTTLLLP